MKWQDGDYSLTQAQRESIQESANNVVPPSISLMTVGDLTTDCV